MVGHKIWGFFYRQMCLIIPKLSLLLLLIWSSAPSDQYKMELDFQDCFEREPSYSRISSVGNALCFIKVRIFVGK